MPSVPCTYYIPDTCYMMSAAAVIEMWVLRKSLFGLSRRSCALISCGCCNKVPHTGWLQTTQMYSHNSGGQVLRSEIKVLSELQLHWKESILCLFQLLAALGIPWLMATSFSVLSSHCLLFCVSGLFPFMLAFRAHLHSPNNIVISGSELNYSLGHIRYCSEVQGTRTWTYLLWVTIQPTRRSRYICLEKD